jgi:hypothetical protein
MHDRRACVPRIADISWRQWASPRTWPSPRTRLHLRKAKDPEDIETRRGPVRRLLVSDSAGSAPTGYSPRVERPPPTRTETTCGGRFGLTTNLSSTMEGRRVLVTVTAAWVVVIGSVRVERSHIDPGRMGATPQPETTIASHDNQQRRFRKSGRSNASKRNQRSGESIDTVGVTGSIPVSPTLGGPVIRGLQSFPDLSRAVLGPHERWSRWLP